MIPWEREIYLTLLMQWLEEEEERQKVPRPDFLRRMLSPFQDPAIGMVQARWAHLNLSQNPLTEAQAAFLDAHFTIDHQVRAHFGRFFNFNGTAGVWRREVIDQAGGWDARTLTEDLDLSLRAQLKVAQRFTRTEITVRLRSALPSGTQVAHIDHLQGGEPLHGDPILSTALAATSDDLETLLSVLSRPDVRGPLLAVLHGHPGSRLTTVRVQLVAQGRLGRALPTALDDLVDLVCALDA